MNRFIWLGMVVLAAVGLWSAAWFYAAGEVRQAVAGLAASDASPSLSCAELEIGGFPFRFDVDCSGATLSDGDATLTLAGLRASLLAYNPTHAVLSALAPLAIEDAFTGSRRRIDFAAAEASVRLATDDILAGLGGEGWRLARASLVVDDIVLLDTLVGEARVGSAGRLEAHLMDMPERHAPADGIAALALYGVLHDVAVPALAVAGGEAAFQAELGGVPDDLRRLLGPDLLRHWRDNGGQLDNIDLEAKAGDEFVTAEGSLALDAEGRPEGQVTLTSRGLVERLGPLIPQEWKPLLLGQPAEDGSYTATLNLRGGFVFAGLVPVAQLEPLL